MENVENYWAARSAELQSYSIAIQQNTHERISALEHYGATGAINSEVDLNWLRGLCGAVLATEAVAPFQGFDMAPLNALKDSVGLFFARLKLDSEAGRELPPSLAGALELVQVFSGVGADFLTVHELSLLWQMHPNNIRGEVLSQPEIKPLLEKQDKLVVVPVALALALSAKRRNFTPSPVAESEGMVLVPVTAKGEFFHAGCSNSKGYRIGRKGEEFLLEDFDSALEALKTMKPKAYWRRRNEAGNWGLVAASNWELRSVDEVYGK